MLKSLSRKHLICATILLFLVNACKFADSREVLLANTAISVFHQNLNSENYNKIYDEAHKEFKDTISKDEAIKYFSSIKKKLGAVKTKKLTNCDINLEIRGGIERKLVICFYETDFIQGKAYEEFIWLIDKNTAILFRYNIQSPLFIIN